MYWCDRAIFVMLVTARKRAEINDQLSIKFACKKEQDTSYNAMDKRVAIELLENDFYKKEVSFEEFTKLLQFGRDEERLYLWRGITSKYDPVIPGKEFFKVEGNFRKSKIYEAYNRAGLFFQRCPKYCLPMV